MPAKNGNTVKVEYTGTLEDGTVFDDSTRHGAPLEFTLGMGKVVRGFEEAILGLVPGEEKSITLQPKDAYGERRPDLIKEIVRQKAIEEENMKPGIMIALVTSEGVTIPGIVLEVKEENLVVDFNPPLAGKTLAFSIKLLEIVE